MSHIVIHDDSNNVTHYAEFGDLQAAAAHLEDLVNQDSDANARLFALEPVEFAIKSYVRIEIGATDATVEASAEDEPLAPTAVNGSEVDETQEVEEVDDVVAEVFTDDPHDDTIEYVEAAMAAMAAPVDPFAPGPSRDDRGDDVPAGDSRRGLFGR